MNAPFVVIYSKVRNREKRYATTVSIDGSFVSPTSFVEEIGNEIAPFVRRKKITPSCNASSVVSHPASEDGTIERSKTQCGSNRNYFAGDSLSVELPLKNKNSSNVFSKRRGMDRGAADFVGH